MAESDEVWGIQFKKVVAALILIILMGNLTGIVLLAFYKLNITGTVTAEILITEVVSPAATILSIGLVLVIYVSLKVVMGKHETNSAVSRLAGIVLDAGAARERRRMNGNQNEDE